MLGLAHPVRKKFLSHAPDGAGPESGKGDTTLWVPPIQCTMALDGSGVGELADSIERHADYLRASGEWGRRERARLEFELEALITETLTRQFRARVGEVRYSRVVDDLIERRLSPGEAVQALLKAKD
jgi:LAO/AO transport system kinase